MKFIIKQVSIKKTVKKKYIFFFSADMHLGGKVIKIAVICQQMVIWLQLCADMIAKTLTFHFIPNLSHLEHIEHRYKVIIAKAKFCPRGICVFRIPLEKSYKSVVSPYIFIVSILFLIVDTEG